MTKAFFEIYTPQGKVALSSNFTPQAYKFSAPSQQSSVHYTGAYTNTYNSNLSSMGSRRFYEIFGGYSQAEFPSGNSRFVPRKVSSGTDHYEIRLVGSELMWVCAPNSALFSKSSESPCWARKNVDADTKPEAGDIVVTGGYVDREGRYLNIYNEDGSLKWSVTNFTRLPSIQFVHTFEVGAYAEAVNSYDNSLWITKISSNRYKYTSKDGNRLFVCVTATSSFSSAIQYVWSADGKTVEVSINGAKESIAKVAGYNAKYPINVFIASFPTVDFSKEIS